MGIILNRRRVMGKKRGEDYSEQYLTFEIVEGGDVTFVASHGDYVRTIYYSLNGGNWVSVTSSTTPQQLGGILQAGDKVRVRGLNKAYFNNATNKRNSFGGTAKVNVFGNILSLTYGDNFKNKTVPESNFSFLFRAYNGLLSAEYLVIPWDYIATHGLKMMFQDCINLTTAPTIKGQLSTSNCCRQMFYGCSSLSKIVCLATDISGASATLLWVKGVAATGTFFKHPNATWTTGTSGIPTGWTVEDVVMDK